MSYEWKSPSPMPSKRVFSTAVEVDGQLYVLGGCDVTGRPLDNLEKYDPVSDSWTELSVMPTKRAGTFAASVGKLIVTVGGISTSQQPVDVVEIFSCEDNSWKTGASLQEKLLGLSGVVRNGRVIVVGGMGVDTKPKDYLLEYDLTTDKWKALPPMPTPRYAAFTFLINDSLYVIGGRQGKNPMKAFEMFSFKDHTWTKLADIPNSHVFAAYVHCDGLIYNLGGLNSETKQGFSDSVEMYNIEEGGWKIMSPMLNKRADFAACCVGDTVVVAGGLGNDGTPLKKAEVYHLTSDSWKSIPDLPSAHCSCAFTRFQNQLYIIGGLSVGGPTGNVDALSYKP